MNVAQLRKALEGVSDEMLVEGMLSSSGEPVIITDTYVAEHLSSPKFVIEGDIDLDASGESS